MKVERARIKELRSQLAESSNVKELALKLYEVAPEFHEALRRSRLLGHREDLGLYVISLDMPYQGLAGLGGAETLVALKEGISSFARRQTLAHECAHGLLRDVDRLRLKLTREREDQLCSQFARRALMPHERVRSYIEVHGFPASIDALEAFCSEFKVGLRPAIATLNEHGNAAGPTVLVAATLRGHEKRPREVAYRVDAAASNSRLFVPRDRRLTSMGLGGMVRWANRGEPGATRSGAEKHVLLNARLPHIKCWAGRAIWSARLFNAAAGYEHPGGRSLIAVLDRSQLKPLPTDPTTRHKPLRPPPLHPQQISFN